MPSNITFGITFLPQFPPEALAEYARMAEAAGFDRLWLYEDCFYGGGFASAAALLSATRAIRVGISILPVTVRNPLFAAMEISTLARLYPGRFAAGFGHGFAPWMKQIGAAPKSSLQAVEETVTAVRSLLSGAETTLHGSHVHLEQVRLLLPPQTVPPLLVGGVRAKTLRLAGRIGDGVTLSVLSSPAYVRWACEQVNAGAAEAGQAQPACIVSLPCKAGLDGAAARAPVRGWLAEAIHGGGAHLIPLGIDEEARALFSRFGLEEGARQMPEAWVDALSASGTPEQAAETVRQIIAAGADEVVLAPVEYDPAAFEETVRCMAPVLREMRE